MSNTEDISKIIIEFLKKIEVRRINNRQHILKTGQGAIDGFGNDVVDCDFVNTVLNLHKWDGMKRAVFATLRMSAGIAGPGEKVVSNLLDELELRMDKSLRLAPRRVDSPRGEIIRSIADNMNSKTGLTAISRRALLEVEARILDNVCRFLEGEFVDDEPFWNSLTAHDDELIRSLSSVFFARELSRRGNGRKALNVLFCPRKEDPGADTIYICSMHLNLEIQIFCEHDELGIRRILDKLILFDEILMKFYPSYEGIDRVDDHWIHKEMRRLIFEVKLAGPYLMFNNLILSALVMPAHAERYLRTASMIADFVAVPGRWLGEQGGDMDVKTATRMLSLVAVAADNLYSRTANKTFLDIRNAHLAEMMGEPRGILTQVDQFAAARKDDMYVREPAFQVGSLLAGELMVMGEPHGLTRETLSRARNHIDMMRKESDAGRLRMIDAFARSRDFYLYQRENAPRSVDPETWNAENFRLYVSRRVF